MIDSDPRLQGYVLLVLTVTLFLVALIVLVLLMGAWRRSLRRMRKTRKREQTPYVDAWSESAKRLPTEEHDPDDMDRPPHEPGSDDRDADQESDFDDEDDDDHPPPGFNR